eukprot:SM000007S20873  [mRNA]  locus=s7:597744:599168:- [translate_table: standard]
MGHQAVWNSHPKNYGPGSRTCRVCGNCHGMIRKYNINCCRQCFRIYSKDIGFVKEFFTAASGNVDPLSEQMLVPRLETRLSLDFVSLRAGMPEQALGQWAEEPRSKSLLIRNVMQRWQSAGQAVAE